MRRPGRERTYESLPLPPQKKKGEAAITDELGGVLLVPLQLLRRSTPE